MKTHTIGQSQWSRDDLLNALEEFSRIYENRPIQDNEGGMKAAQMFYAWFVAKSLQPKTIIESGIWYGQSTWMFEQAVPDADLFCIDPATYYKKGYTSGKAKYFKKDFTKIDWSHINPKTTFCFFDDHQNALQRMIHCAQLGFQHLMFEDNYPPGKGDCYSLKKAFHASETRTLLPGLAIRDYCENLIDVYQEFPPIISPEMNRWGEPWSTYDVDEPLTTEIQNEFQSIYAEESENYTWVNYVKLKEFEKNKHCIQLSDLKKKFDWSSMV